MDSELEKITEPIVHFSNSRAKKVLWFVLPVKWPFLYYRRIMRLDV